MGRQHTQMVTHAEVLKEKAVKGRCCMVVVPCRLSLEASTSDGEMQRVRTHSMAWASTLLRWTKGGRTGVFLARLVRFLRLVGWLACLGSSQSLSSSCERRWLEKGAPGGVKGLNRVRRRSFEASVGDGERCGLLADGQT